MNKKNTQSTLPLQTPKEVDRNIIKLALPSLGTLLVEPFLVAVDSAMVGHLGTSELAGLSLASAILTAFIGLCIFLTYATTSATARAVGKGNYAIAARHGIDGIWLAAGIGVILGGILFIFARPILQIFHPSSAVLNHATAYLQASTFGIPGMLLVLATTGALRGFANTKTPLFASTAGALINIPLNFLLIYIAEFGVAGAGYGTAIAQSGMGIFLIWQFLKIARFHGASLHFSGGKLLRSLNDSFPLIIRNLSLRISLLLQIAAATALGTVALATNQIVMSIWNFASYGLDSLAIAAQILIGQALGAGDILKVRLILRRCLQWGIRAGLIIGIIFAGLAFFIPHLMSADPAVQKLSLYTIWLISLTLPISAIAYLLDGVLIGAGDLQKLAKYMVIALLSFAPIAGGIVFFSNKISAIKFANVDGDLNFGVILGMLLLWIGYAIIFMGARAATMYYRAKGEAWMKLKV